MDELGYVEIEAGIVDKYDNVGLPCEDIFLAHGHVAEDSGQVKQNGDETHVGKLAKMFYTCSAFGRHQVTAKVAELSRFVVCLQRLHQMAGMKVSRGFAHNEVVFHFLRF